MADDRADWTEFYQRAQRRPPRELLRRTLGCFEIEKAAPGVAVDLGCGSGAETLELLARGWTVHALDADPSGLTMLGASVPRDFAGRFHPHVSTFEAFAFPRCDLIWAGFSLPYCPAAQWPGLVERMRQALCEGGRLAGDVFGERHAWRDEPAIHVVGEAELRAMLAGFEIEAFDVEDGVRPSGGAITRWHAFGICARKPAVTVAGVSPR